VAFWVNPGYFPKLLWTVQRAAAFQWRVPVGERLRCQCPNNVTAPLALSFMEDTFSPLTFLIIDATYLNDPSVCIPIYPIRSMLTSVKS
jgi:hypothetical protein